MSVSKDLRILYLSIRLSLLSALTALSLNCFSQKQTYNWYFGNNAGISFNSGTAVPLTNGIINAWEGCATISDKTGKLLFYTEGIEIRNANHQVMTNGTGLNGHVSSSQSAVIVPQPGNDSIYFIFTVNIDARGLFYSVVNMNRQGGLGEVVQKNVFVVANAREKLTAVLHCNNRDVWVVVKIFDTDTYNAYLVSASGVSSTAVISSTGNIIGPDSDMAAGVMKFSPDGKKLAAAYANRNDYIELLDFNTQTGLLSNPVKLSTRPANANVQSIGVYGLEFSKGNRFLYTTSVYSTLELRSLIHQFDVSLPSVGAIQASRYHVNSQSNLQHGGMQLGPDGRIYVSEGLSSYLSLIEAPDNAGQACSFQPRSFFLGQSAINFSNLGLPSFIQSYLLDSTLSSFSENGNCNTTRVNFNLNNTQGVDSVKWDFGDPVTGSLNYSTLTNPAHSFSKTGIFDVKVILFKGPCDRRDTVEKSIWVGQVNSFLGNDTTLCDGDTIRLRATNLGVLTKYLWSNGSTDSTITINQPGKYWVDISVGNCNFSDTIEVFYNPIPSAFTLGADTSICENETITLQPDIKESGNTYQWNTGSTNSMLTTNTAGNYWLKVTNSFNCSRSDSQSLSIRPLPVFTLGSDRQICSDSTLTITISNINGAFLWNTGNTSNQQVISSSGWYWLDISINNCTARDSINVFFKPLPNPKLGSDTVLCKGHQLLLDASTLADRYQWQDGSASPQFIVENKGVYSVTAFLNGCKASDSIRVEMSEKPLFDLGPDQIFCKGAKVVLNPTVSSYSPVDYLWQDRTFASSFQVKDTGTYILQVSNICGITSDTIAFRNGYCDLKIPNAFTPNRDGRNDLFRAKFGGNVADYHLLIYNRWGQLIFETKDLSKGWDGTKNGRNLEGGTYVWMIEYRDWDNKKQILKGAVQLIR